VSNNRLGKGLEALIRPVEEQDGPRRPGVTNIDINKIKPNPHQPRKHFDDTALEELTASIIEKGILTPITVRPDGSNFILIAGERRLRASEKAGLTDIPVYILNIDKEVDMVEMALIENIQRENLNAIEAAEGFAVLNGQFNLSQGEIAKAVGKSRVTITNSLRLLGLPSEIINSIRNGEISAGHGRAILMMKTQKTMFQLWKKILDQGLSVREAEAESGKKPDHEPKKRKVVKIAKDGNFIALENELISILGTKVKVLPKKKGGSLEIDYYSDDDLERILDLIRNIL